MDYKMQEIRADKYYDGETEADTPTGPIKRNDSNSTCECYLPGEDAVPCYGWCCGGSLCLLTFFFFGGCACFTPCWMARSCCSGNPAAMYVGRPLMFLVLALFMWPMALVSVLFFGIFGFILDIVQLVVWLLTCGCCFQQCDFIPQVRGVEVKHGGGRAPSRTTDPQPVQCPPNRCWNQYLRITQQQWW